jgi:hypothetical protein
MNRAFLMGLAFPRVRKSFVAFLALIDDMQKTPKISTLFSVAHAIYHAYCQNCYKTRVPLNVTDLPSINNRRRSCLARKTDRPSGLPESRNIKTAVRQGHLSQKNAQKMTNNDKIYRNVPTIFGQNRRS